MKGRKEEDKREGREGVWEGKGENRKGCEGKG